jgi:hypothetical protein
MAGPVLNHTDSSADTSDIFSIFFCTVLYRWFRGPRYQAAPLRCTCSGGPSGPKTFAFTNFHYTGPANSETQLGVEKETKGEHLPDTEVHVIRAGKHIRGVPREAHGEHALHALRVVHLARVASVVGEDANRAVITPRHKLTARGRVVHIHHCRCEILCIKHKLYPQARFEPLHPLLM